MVLIRQIGLTFVIFLFTCVYNPILSAYHVTDNVETEEDRIIYGKYIKLDKQLKSIISAGTKMALPFLMQSTERLNLSSSCTANIMTLLSGIKNLKLSAFKFLDATGKMSEGYLNGNMHMLGDYDECLNSTVRNRHGLVAFRGQYCLLNYKPLLPKQKRPVTLHSGIEELVAATKNTSEVMQYIVSKAQLFYYNPSKFGVCVPSGCSKRDMDQIVQLLSESLSFDASVAYCDMDDETFLNYGNIIYVCLFVFIAAVSLAGSLIEYFSWKRKINLNNLAVKVFMCFSILTNFPRAISTKTSKDSISCLHGIRALTLFYIILLHQYYAVVKYFISTHVSRQLDEIPQFFMQIVTNGFLTADVFFFVGGLVNCYTRMKMDNKERRKENVFMIINHRIWRIGPAYLFFCLMMSLYRPYGPMRVYERQEYVEKCEKYWWQNALFINNFFLQDDTCSPHSWYIAADMQLFLLSLITIPLFFKHPKKGIIVNAAMIFIGIFSTIIGMWVMKITPGVVFYRPNKDEINKAWNAHTSTFPHISSYFTGVLMGYFLASKKEIKLSNMCQVIGWPIALLLFTSMMFMTQIWNSGGLFTAAESAFYYGFSKFLFVLAIAWMVLCCTTGNGGIINYILCLPVWVPIARIGFVVYLIAPFMQTFYFANSRTLVDGHRMALIWRYAGDTVISCLSGLVIAVLIEFPSKGIEKLLFDRWSLKQETGQDKTNEVVIKTVTLNKIEKIVN